MDIINQFLENPVNAGNPEEDILVTANEVKHVNDMFSSLRTNLPFLRILPKCRKNQIWTVIYLLQQLHNQYNESRFPIHL